MHWGLWGRGERGDGAEVPAERGGGWRCRVQGRRCTCTSRMLWAHAWREKHVCVQALDEIKLVLTLICVFSTFKTSFHVNR